MTDVMLSLEPADGLRRLTLASSIRDETLAELERAIALERAKRAALLKAAKTVDMWWASVAATQHEPDYSGRAPDAITALRAAIAKAERETP